MLLFECLHPLACLQCQMSLLSWQSLYIYLSLYLSEGHFSLWSGRLHAKGTFFKPRWRRFMLCIPASLKWSPHFQCYHRLVAANAANLWRDVSLDRFCFVLTFFSRRVSVAWWGMSVSSGAPPALRRRACTQFSFPNVPSEEETHVHDSKQIQHLPCCFLPVSPAFTLIDIFSSLPR